MEITLLRIFTHHLVNTFLPTSSLILITEMALFVDTGHLIMLRMFFVYPISRRLCQKQPTSFEMINILLLARLIFTFHSFHHLGLVDTKRLEVSNVLLQFDPDPQEKPHKLLKGAKVWVPLMTFGFFIVYCLCLFCLEDLDSFL